MARNPQCNACNCYGLPVHGTKTLMEQSPQPFFDPQVSMAQIRLLSPSRYPQAVPSVTGRERSAHAAQGRQQALRGIGLRERERELVLYSVSLLRLVRICLLQMLSSNPSSIRWQTNTQPCDQKSEHPEELSIAYPRTLGGSDAGAKPVSHSLKPDADVPNMQPRYWAGLFLCLPGRFNTIPTPNNQKGKPTNMSTRRSVLLFEST